MFYAKLEPSMRNQQPFFSIVIPTYNRPEKLKSCLESLTCLDYDSDRFEIVLVDDGSPQSSESIVTPFQNKLNIQLSNKIMLDLLPLEIEY